MSNKKRIAAALAVANGMELNTEGTHVWSTPAHASKLLSNFSGKPITPTAAQELAINAGWEDYAGELYGSLDALCQLLDTLCDMEAEDA